MRLLLLLRPAGVYGLAAATRCMPNLIRFFGAAVCLTAAASAAELRLASPLACGPAEGCSIQNYVDAEPGPGVQDFACGVLSYDGHRGTDFQVPDLKRMRRGVPVLAAASGVVRDVRDGMPDTGKQAYDARGEADRALGNVVALDHGSGWTTFYGHLRQGSLKVRPGDRVAQGQVLGEIGLSGSTEFPHVHFELRHEGKVIDPFTGAAPGMACGGTTGSLWAEATRAERPYVATGIICAGWSAAALERAAVLEDCERPADLTRTSPAIVAWIEAFGLRKGDEIRITVSSPDGSTLAQSAHVVDRDAARRFRVVGRKRTAAEWPAGVYRARYLVVRQSPSGAQTVLDHARDVEVR
ncbi:MAG: M23 family metallopeptidase [Betaproteobacteria bacterium]|nr:M23 family metallopeptidase [Betaproteobacteria bacterium]